MDRNACLRLLDAMENLSDSPSSFLGVLGNALSFYGEFTEADNTRLNIALTKMREELHK